MRKNPGAFKEELENGPMLVIISYCRAYWFYRSGIFDNDECNAAGISHAVAMVGFGVDRDTETKYWNIKNSLGP